jgi:FKBP-type peptidyl-prolyl cis-trans isomerase
LKSPYEIKQEDYLKKQKEMKYKNDSKKDQIIQNYLKSRENESNSNQNNQNSQKYEKIYDRKHTKTSKDTSSKKNTQNDKNTNNNQYYPKINKIVIDSVIN